MGLVNDVLDISRIEAGRMPVQLTEFATDQLIKEVTAELEAVIARSAGPGRRRNRVRRADAPASDRQKVKQIVTNLLSNALKFTQHGQITIRASCDVTDGHVRDLGPGHGHWRGAEADHDRIFEDFHQVDSSTTKQFGGTGLGLAISKRLAHHAGRAAVRSTDSHGPGATFTLELPRLAAAGQLTCIGSCAAAGPSEPRRQRWQGGGRLEPPIRTERTRS